MNKPIIVGIAGGSGSGKTTFAKKLLQILGSENAVIIGQDSYYFDQHQRFDHDGGSVNFDHPDAIDFDLLASHLNLLKQNHEVSVPIYNFATHSRMNETQVVLPHPIIIVDGILILGPKILNNCFDYSLFIDVPEEVRYERRLHRDVNERGRTPLGVYKQFHKQVKPMHDEFVAPSRVNANQIVTMQSFDRDLLKFADYIRSNFS